MTNEEAFEIHQNKRKHKVYVSRSIVTGEAPNEVPRRFRIASKVLDSPTGYEFVTEAGEHVIRITGGGKQEVIVKFYEDDRDILGITLQRFSVSNGKPHKHSFSFIGEEIPRFLEFLLNVCRVRIPNESKFSVTDAELHKILLSPERLSDIIRDNQDRLLEWAKSEVTTSDIVALGYRRKQLDRFGKMLSDPAYFAAERASANKSEEAMWQMFFEENKWVFGYGLSYFFMSNLEGRGLEQTIAGSDLWGDGKRPDAVLKTKGFVQALCFVEVKKHNTDLLKPSVHPYRPGCWLPSDDLTGGVVQSQATIEKIVRRIVEQYKPKTVNGDPTGEELYAYQPRSYLIIGNQAEFGTGNGLNVDKYRSFELFRRNVLRPEILTFDELYERAKFLVEYEEK
jgi:hypothetical protein